MLATLGCRARGSCRTEPSMPRRRWLWRLSSRIQLQPETTDSARCGWLSQTPSCSYLQASPQKLAPEWQHVGRREIRTDGTRCPGTGNVVAVVTVLVTVRRVPTREPLARGDRYDRCSVW